MEMQRMPCAAAMRKSKQGQRVVVTNFVVLHAHGFGLAFFG